MPILFRRLRRSFSPRPLKTSILSATVAAALVGCTADAPSPPGNDRFLVEPIRLTHKVTFAGGQSELAPAAAYELSAFLDEADPDRRADIYLDASGSEKNGRLDAVGVALGQLGRESAGTGGGEGTDYGVTVTVLQDVILPESCLDSDGWPEPHLPPASCTTALTLVRMVENPDDLLRGREMGPALSASAASAAARHLQRRTPAPVEERPASIEPDAAPQLPPAPQTRDASY